MTELIATEIAIWAYPDAWSVYNLTTENALFSSAAGYFAVVGSNGTLVGFACSGLEARVPGLAEKSDTLDIGFGMNPVFVGQGHGMEFASVIMDYFQKSTSRNFFRCVVQRWNERSLRTLKSLKFDENGIHAVARNGKTVDYTILSRTVEPNL